MRPLRPTVVGMNRPSSPIIIGFDTTATTGGTSGLSNILSSPNTKGEGNQAKTTTTTTSAARHSPSSPVHTTSSTIRAQSHGCLGQLLAAQRQSGGGGGGEREKVLPSCPSSPTRNPPPYGGSGISMTYGSSAPLSSNCSGRGGDTGVGSRKGERPSSLLTRGMQGLAALRPDMSSSKSNSSHHQNRSPSSASSPQEGDTAREGMTSKGSATNNNTIDDHRQTDHSVSPSSSSSDVAIITITTDNHTGGAEGGGQDTKEIAGDDIPSAVVTEPTDNGEENGHNSSSLSQRGITMMNGKMIYPPTMADEEEKEGKNAAMDAMVIRDHCDLPGRGEKKSLPASEEHEEGVPSSSSLSHGRELSTYVNSTHHGIIFPGKYQQQQQQHVSDDEISDALPMAIFAYDRDSNSGHWGGGDSTGGGGGGIVRGERESLRTPPLSVRLVSCHPRDMG